VLLFASSIVVMVHDIQAVNHFQLAKSLNDTAVIDNTLDCDYIECARFPINFFWIVLIIYFILQWQHRAESTRRCLLGRDQQALHHLPSNHPHIIRNRLAIQTVRALLSRSRKELWSRCSRGHPMFVSPSPPFAEILETKTLISSS
jgi:hypothetical protein